MNSLKILSLLIIGVLSNKSCHQPERDEDYIGLFEKRIKIDTTKYKSLIKCRREFQTLGSRKYETTYFIRSNYENVTVGSDKYYMRNGKLLFLGTWQTKTDSFLLNGTDTMIIFYNPFAPNLFCHPECDTAFSTSLRACFTGGYAYEWHLNGKLIKKTVKYEKGEIYILQFDSITGKMISKKKG